MSKVCYTLKYLKMGYRLGIVRIVGSKVHLEVISLPPSLQEGFNLERTSLNVERVHPIRLSPKLDLLVLGRFALTFGTETNELPPPMECDIEPSVPVAHWSHSISRRTILQDYYDRQPGRSVMIFRINRAERRAHRNSSEDTIPERCASSFTRLSSIATTGYIQLLGRGGQRQ